MFKKMKQSNDPGEQGMFYAQKLCLGCKKLIVSSSPKSIRAANSDLGQRLKIHRQECKKDDSQLELSISSPGQEQVESVKRISLKGDMK